MCIYGTDLRVVAQFRLEGGTEVQLLREVSLLQGVSAQAWPEKMPSIELF